MSYRLATYRGDPGLNIGRFIRRAAGSLLGSVPGVGGALNIARGLMSGGQRPQVVSGVPMTPGMGPVLIAPGVTGGMSPLGTVGVSGGQPGQHLNRSGYWTKAGYVPKGTRWVRNRSTNYGNGRALKRSLRRAHGFQHLAKSVMSFTMTGRRTGRPFFKKRTRTRS